MNPPHCGRPCRVGRPRGSLGGHRSAQLYRSFHAPAGGRHHPLLDPGQQTNAIARVCSELPNRGTRPRIGQLPVYGTARFSGRTRARPCVRDSSICTRPNHCRIGHAVVGRGRVIDSRVAPGDRISPHSPGGAPSQRIITGGRGSAGIRGRSGLVAASGTVPPGPPRGRCSSRPQPTTDGPDRRGHRTPS